MLHVLGLLFQSMSGVVMSCSMLCCVVLSHVVLCVQEDNFDEAVKAAFHAWTPPSIRESTDLGLA